MHTLGSFFLESKQLTSNCKFILLELKCFLVIESLFWLKIKLIETLIFTNPQYLYEFLIFRRFFALSAIVSTTLYLIWCFIVIFITLQSLICNAVSWNKYYLFISSHILYFPLTLLWFISFCPYSFLNNKWLWLHVSALFFG